MIAWTREGSTAKRDSVRDSPRLNLKEDSQCSFNPNWQTARLVPQHPQSLFKLSCELAFEWSSIFIVSAWTLLLKARYTSQPLNRDSTSPQARLVVVSICPLHIYSYPSAFIKTGRSHEMQWNFSKALRSKKRKYKNKEILLGTKLSSRKPTVLQQPTGNKPLVYTCALSSASAFTSYTNAYAHTLTHKEPMQTSYRLNPAASRSEASCFPSSDGLIVDFCILPSERKYTEVDTMI